MKISGINSGRDPEGINFRSPLVCRTPSLNPELESRAHITRVKAELLTQGVAIDPTAARELLDNGWKAPKMVRSGMSGGLEFYLSINGQRVAISCAYSLKPSQSIVYTLFFDQGFFLAGPNGEKVGMVELIPEPSYYRRKTSGGTDMASVGQQCFTKLAIGVFRNCSFNDLPEAACGFCSIHTAADSKVAGKTDSDILETVEAAFESELGPQIETVMLGGGTPVTPDRGAIRFASLSHQIKQLVPWRITVMMAPPAEDKDLTLLRDSGVSDISINLEFGSEETFNPKEGLIPRSLLRYRQYEILAT